MDQFGHFIRFPASAGNSSLYLPCQVYLANPAAAKLLECRTLQRDLNSLLSYVNAGHG
jgi:hypothetical protein